MSSGTAVYIDSTGKLGTQASSQRFKMDIQSLDAPEDKIQSLRPVTFRYKEANHLGVHPLQHGLIAEEVAEVFPDLVQYDDKGKPFAIYYQLLTPLLLAELQRGAAENQKLAQELKLLRQQVASQTNQMASWEKRLGQLQHLVQLSGPDISVAVRDGAVR